MTENHDYYPGQKLSWYHGHAYLKVVKVLEVEPDRVRVQGMSSTYWIRKTTLEKNLGKPQPKAPTLDINNGV